MSLRPDAPILIVTTCGTSILTNHAPSAERAALMRHANAVSLDDVAVEDRAPMEAWSLARLNDVVGWTDAQARQGSAELNMIETWLPRAGGRRVEHVVVGTGTWLGRRTAEAVAEYLRAKGQATEMRVFASLQTADLASMRHGLDEVVAWAHEELMPRRDAGYEIVFNLTGGFKGVSGFFQSLGMIHADRNIFLFESSREVMEIPRLPVALSVDATVRAAITPLRRMALGLDVDAAAVAQIPESLIFAMDGEATLSAWGQLAWKMVRDEIYGERSLLPPPSPLIAYGPMFERSVNAGCADASRWRAVHTRLDMLALFLEGRGNLNALDFKTVRSGKHGATHEIDAWADRDARRIMLRKEPEGRYTVLALVDHL